MSHEFDRNIPSPQWYALWTRSRHEKSAATTLEELSISTYLPLTQEIRQWSDRKQVVTTPLFTGYLFVRLNLARDNSRLQILKTPGIVGFVGNNAGPLAIPDQQIESIRKLLSSGIDYTVGPQLVEGDRIRVVRGSLSGMEGVLVRTSSETRLILSVDLVRRSLSIDVSRQDVELIDGRAA